MIKSIRLFNKLKLNNSLICFIPILVFLPLIYQLINNFHIGGIDLFIDFSTSALNPEINKEIIYISIIRLKETFFISFISWVISILLGTILGIFSSNIFYKFIKIPIFIKILLKFFLNIIRSLHETIWCLILMQIFGMSKSIGIIAICIPFTAINAKVISEQLEIINAKTIRAIIHLGGDNFSSLLTLIWGPILKILKNFGLYRFECALRSTAILGLFGIGGIGTSIFLSYQSLNFKEMWTYFWSLAILIIISKKIINKVIIKKFNPKIFLILLTLSIISVSLYFYEVFDYLIISNNFAFVFKDKYLALNSSIIPNNFFKSIFETINLCIIATAIALSLPPFLLFFSQNKYYVYFIRVIAFFFRTIPSAIIILILLMFNQPSLSLAAITLGLHNAAITFKLLNENLKQEDNNTYIAIKCIGSSSRISWIYGLFNKQCKSYMSYCAYRSDILVRESAIVGIIGSIGLGWQLNESLSSFAWNEVMVILFSYSVIAIIGELINGKIKSKLNI